MTRPNLRKASIGLCVHSGWAALVALAAPVDAPEVIARRRIEIADPGIRGSKQPYHAAEPMEFPYAQAHIERCAASTRKLAREALRAAIDGLRDKRCEAIVCGIVMGSGRALPTLEAILRSHALIHTAEGEFFRNALAEAGEHCGLRVLGVKAKELSERGAAYLPRVQGMGKALGPPWTQDQKSATLVAWLALSGFAL